MDVKGCLKAGALPSPTSRMGPDVYMEKTFVKADTSEADGFGVGLELNRGHAVNTDIGSRSQQVLAVRGTTYPTVMLRIPVAAGDDDRTVDSIPQLLKFGKQVWM